MKHFRVTITTRAGRTIRNVIAQSSIRAIQTALNTLPGMPGMFSISCRVAA